MGNAMYRKQAANKEYQSWTGYPDSIVKSVDFPYQALAWAGGVVRLYCSTVPLKVSAGHNAFQVASTVIDGHYLIWQYDPSGATWVYYTDGWYMGIAAIEQANHDVCEQNGTTVYFSKTTTTEQDGGSTTSLIRIRNLHHKDGASVVRDKAAFWKENVASGYQQWTGYPDSLVLTSVYPYQVLGLYAGFIELNVSTIPLYHVGSSNPITLHGGSLYVKYYYYYHDIWNLGNAGFTPTYDSQSTIYQANHDIYTDITLTGIYVAKTTTSSQDAGVSETLHRINI